MAINIRKTKSGFTITAKGRKSGVALMNFVNGLGSGAKAAADSPAPDVSEASPTRTGNTTEIGHD